LPILPGIEFHPTQPIAYALTAAQEISRVDLATGQTDRVVDGEASSLHLSPSGKKLLALTEMGHVEGTHLKMIDLETLQVTEAKREWSAGDIEWVDDETFAFSIVDRGAGTPSDNLVVYTSSLDVSKVIPGFGATSIVVKNDLVTGVKEGALVQASLSTGVVRTITRLEATERFPLLLELPVPRPTISKDAATFYPDVGAVDQESSLLRGRSPDFRNQMVRSFVNVGAAILALIVLVAGLLIGGRKLIHTWRGRARGLGGPL